MERITYVIRKEFKEKEKFSSKYWRTKKKKKKNSSKVSFEGFTERKSIKFKGVQIFTFHVA